MDIELTRQFLDSCHEARRICELLPNLPPHIKPRHIRIIKAVHDLREEKKAVRVSDVSTAMQGTMPSITKLVNELCDLGVMNKRQSKNDKRVFTLKLTAKGERYYDIYVRHFHTWLTEQMQSIPDEDVEATVRTIEKVKAIVEKGREDYGPMD